MNNSEITSSGGMQTVVELLYLGALLLALALVVLG